jgi:hypothetical protein
VVDWLVGSVIVCIALHSLVASNCTNVDHSGQLEYYGSTKLETGLTVHVITGLEWLKTRKLDWLPGGGFGFKNDELAFRLAQSTYHGSSIYGHHLPLSSAQLTFLSSISFYPPQNRLSLSHTISND